jgi:hypothetical protein
VTPCSLLGFGGKSCLHHQGLWLFSSVDCNL